MAEASATDIEGLRLFLTLPCSHFFNDPQNYDTVICPFAQTIRQLSQAFSKVIGECFELHSPALVCTLKQR
jgi:hypothetical protein